jgi:hypothetical protein
MTEEPINIPIPIRRRDEPISAAQMEANLRRMGWDDSQLTPGMRALLQDIAEGLNEMMRSRDARDPHQ